jgi:TatA/E family protein of Tat protein translocase
MFGIGVQELAIIFVVALLVFGPKRLPELARGLGKAMAEFRRASNDLRTSFNLDATNQPSPSPAPRPVPRPRNDPPTDPRELREPQGVPAQTISPEPPPVRSEAGAPATEEPAESGQVTGAVPEPAREARGD